MVAPKVHITPSPRLAVAPEGGPAWFAEEFFRLHRLGGQHRANALIMRNMLLAQNIMTPEHLTPCAIEIYLFDVCRRSVKTAHNHKAAISAVCQCLVRQGVLSGNPTESIRLPKYHSRFPLVLDEDELRAVLQAAASAGCWPEVALAMSTGLRRGELARLTWPDMDWSRRVVTIRETKAGRSFVASLNVPALHALQQQRQKTGDMLYIFPARHTWRGGWRYVDRPRCKAVWLRLFEPILRAVPKFQLAKGTGRKWHMLRHSFATLAIRRKVDLITLKGWLNHSDIRMTERYVHLAKGYNPAIELVNPLIDPEDLDTRSAS